MPFIDVKTNVSVPADKAEVIKSQLGKAIADIPGKSESWLMVDIEPEHKIWFKGDSAPAAMVQVSIFGTASAGALETLTGHITGIVTDSLGISGDRVYVKYEFCNNWGWNGSNF